MALLFMDGFDWYQGGCSSGAFTGDMGLRYSDPDPNLTFTIAPSYARNPSGQGGLMTGTATVVILKNFGTNYTQGLIGLAINPQTSPASRSIAVITDGGSEQISIRTNSSSVLTVTRSGTVLATGSTVLSIGVWYYLELKFTINNTTGTVELKLNGASEIASTGSLDTQNTANTQWNGFGYMTVNGWNYRIDDVYVLDTSTGANTTFLGPVRIAALYPAAPGNYAQWTANGGSNMGCVSEPYEDGDGSFNQSSTANQIDSYVFDDLPIGSGSVYAVQHVLVARQDSGAARSLAALTRISSTDYVGSTKSLSTSYQFLEQIYDQSPASSSAWTVSEVAGMEAGYKLIA